MNAADNPHGRPRHTLTGTTRLAGLLGWPVSHSLSPRMHNAAYAALGLDWAYAPLPAPPERLGDAVRGLAALGFAGANVTVPHKEAAARFVDALTPAARAIGAVNTIIVQGDGTLLGDNTDAAGFMMDLRAHGVVAPEGPRPAPASPRLRVLLLGAGGAARAAAYALAEAGAEVTIANRTWDKAQALCQIIAAALPQAAGAVHAARWPEDLAARGADAALIVNATSLGLHAGDPLPWDGATPFRPGQVVYDLIYHRPTELLALAQAGGATAINGLGMLIYQGALSAARWTGYGAGDLARWMQKELETL